MKKCPYCGHMNYDDESNCQKCCAAFSSVEEVKVNKQENTEQNEVPAQKKTKRS